LGLELLEALALVGCEGAVFQLGHGTPCLIELAALHEALEEVQEPLGGHGVGFGDRVAGLSGGRRGRVGAGGRFRGGRWRGCTVAAEGQDSDRDQGRDPRAPAYGTSAGWGRVGRGVHGTGHHQKTGEPPPRVRGVMVSHLRHSTWPSIMPVWPPAGRLPRRCADRCGLM